VQAPTGACNSGSYSIPASALAQNSYTAQASQTDAARNTGTSTTNTFTVDTTPPTVSSVTLSNIGSGTAGRVDANDQIVIVFSEQMAVSSFCSTWSGDTSNQTISGNGVATVTLTDGGGSSDSISVSTSGGCAFNFGSISLGNTGYVTGGNATFSGSGNGKTTIAWTASTRTLTITLGTKAGAGTTSAVASSTATYTPSSSITDSAGNGSIAAKSTGTVQQF